jgi:hypothetical protein
VRLSLAPHISTFFQMGLAATSLSTPGELCAPRNISDEIIIVVSLADPLVRSRLVDLRIGRARRFADGRCQQMWPIIKEAAPGAKWTTC